jgi:hypothetical protein
VGFFVFFFMIFGSSICQKNQQEVGKGSCTNIFCKSPNLLTKMVITFSQTFPHRAESKAHVFCVIYSFISFGVHLEHKPCDLKKDPTGMRNGSALYAGTH